MAGTSKDSGPASWADALSEASQAIASGMAAPDADVKFGLAMIGALAEHQKKGHAQSGGAGAGAPGGPGGGGGPAGSPSPPPGGPPPGASPGGPSPAGNPAGGGSPNQQMKSQASPGGPIPGGMSPGLGMSGDAQNADELRRVLADVAGN